MNEHADLHSPSGENLQLQIDRLVDGELSPADSRALLKTLEENPSQWRALALAFVESQAFSADFADLASPANHAAGFSADAKVTAIRPAAARSLWSNAALVTAMAASFLLAFTLSAAAYWGLRGVQGVAPPEMVAQPADDLPEKRPRLAEDKPRNKSNLDTPVPNKITPATDVQSDSLTLIVDQTGDRVELPVYNTSRLSIDEIQQQWAQVSTVRPELVRKLEAEGHAVTLRTHLRQVWLEDGQLLVVPIEELEVTPVSLDLRFQ